MIIIVLYNKLNKFNNLMLYINDARNDILCDYGNIQNKLKLKNKLDLE